jgi:hypothetical protein
MKDFKIYISLAAALILVYLIAQYNKPAPVNWAPSFYYNDKIPFGTYITYHRLNDIFPEANVVKTNTSLYKAFHDSSITQGNYLIIAKACTINKYDFNELVKFIKPGNSVFISSLTLNGFITDTLKLSLSYEYKKDNSNLLLNNKAFSQNKYKFRSDVSNQYFSEFDTAKATVLGTNTYGHNTFLRFTFGKGNLYICANPGVFSNYGLLYGDGAQYSANALSYLPATKTLYWDEFQNGDIPADDSPLRVFFNNPSLQWSYYLSLFSLVVFVLFEIKRRQRIIPVIEPLNNSTLDFVNVVGQVYYEKRNNANIANKKILYFLTHLRDEYQLKTNILDKEFAEKLSGKLGIESNFADHLISYIKYISVQDNVNDRELIELNQLIEKFYTQSR